MNENLEPEDKKEYKRGKGEAGGLDIFAEAMNISEKEAEKRREYEAESKQQHDRGEAGGVDIFAEAMNISEKEAEKRREYESESKQQRGRSEAGAVDIFAEAMNISEKEAEKRREYEAESKQQHDKGGAGAVDIFAEAMNISEKEAEKRREAEAAAKNKRAGGKAEAVDIFAEAMNISEKEAEKRRDYETAGKNKRARGKAKGIDIFAEAMNISEKEAAKLAEHKAGTDKPISVPVGEIDDETIRKKRKKLIALEMLKSSAMLIGAELVTSLAAVALFQTGAIPQNTLGIVSVIGFAFLLYSAAVIARHINIAMRSGFSRRWLRRNCISYGAVALMSVFVWAAGAVVNRWGIHLVSWTLMPLRLFRMTFFNSLGTMGNLYSLLISHAIIFGLILSVHYIMKSLWRNR